MEILHDPVRDGLRRGVSRRQIEGWRPWNTGSGTQMFTVRPSEGWCVDYDEPGALALVHLLDVEAGTRP